MSLALPEVCATGFIPPHSSTGGPLAIATASPPNPDRSSQLDQGEAEVNHVEVESSTDQNNHRGQPLTPEESVLVFKQWQPTGVRIAGSRGIPTQDIADLLQATFLRFFEWYVVGCVCIQRPDAMLTTILLNLIRGRRQQPCQLLDETIACPASLRTAEDIVDREYARAVICKLTARCSERENEALDAILRTGNPETSPLRATGPLRT